MVNAEYLQNIKSGISKYKDEIVPLIKDGYYGKAGIELQNAILILSLAIEKMKEDEFCGNISVLASRFDFLSMACADEHNTGNNKRVVEYGLNLVEEQIKIVEE